MISFEGQCVVVTGAGRGLGRVYAAEVVARGGAVVVNDVDFDAAEQVSESLGARAIASGDSVATAEGGAAIIARALKHFGRVDALVHNAGAWCNGTFAELGPEFVDPVLDVHLRGAFHVARPAWQAMLTQEYGRVVLISSGAGAFGRTHGANYCAAKAGLLGLGRALALEGAEHGIRANCVLPIANTAAGRPPRSGAAEHVRRATELFDRLGDHGRPELVAPIVSLLASEDCPVSGEAFSACGGRFARLVIGLTPGWVAPGDGAASAEDVLDHFDEIEARNDDLFLPESVMNEIEAVVALVGG